jgi:hypothetical protein
MARRPIINKDETHTAAKPVNTDGDDRTEFDADAVALLPESGIIEGHSDGTYGPDDSLTREQAAKMTDLAYDLDDADSDLSFPNSDEITSWTEGQRDDIISGPGAQAAALKANLANLRKDEDDASGIDTNALDDTLGKTLDASTEQGGAPKDAELAAPFVPGGAVLSVGDAPDEDDPKANDIEDA